ncbi:hypothetical protein [Marinobacter alkaliphilus]|uniref:Uncharacterized protein n=1 Tax=Marinobacter alkaliphilus TaxID=254719 RepID=A0ABZ3EAJ5_9GAMM
MGASWGSKWFSVLDSDPAKCRVEMVDCRPGPIGTGDEPWVPLPDHLASCQEFSSEAVAVSAVRAHVLSVSQEKILELVVAVELLKLKIQRLRLLEPKSSARDDEILRLKQEASELTAELKHWRDLRRAKIPVS